MELEKHCKTLSLIKYLIDRLEFCSYQKMAHLIYLIDFESYYKDKIPISDETHYHLEDGTTIKDYQEILELGTKHNLFEIDNNNKIIKKL